MIGIGMERGGDKMRENHPDSRSTLKGVIMGGGASTGKKGGKKYGRLLRSPAHARYVTMNRCLTNKIRKIKKHIKKCVDSKGRANDNVAIAALKRLLKRG